LPNASHLYSALLVPTARICHQMGRWIDEQSREPEHSITRQLKTKVFRSCPVTAGVELNRIAIRFDVGSVIRACAFSAKA